MTVFPWSFYRGRARLAFIEPEPLPRSFSPPQTRPQKRTSDKRVLRDAGTLTRFVAIKPHGNRAVAALRAGHPALQGHTRFPKTVVSPAQAPRVLVGGHNNPKIGRTVMKGPWSGLPIFTLTLEERATCPRACHLWAECYGNAMHWNRRHRADATLIPAIDRDLSQLLREHREGIVVRLHVLGDFVDLDYLRAWVAWMVLHPTLRVFGMTAHPPTSEIGAWIEVMNREWPTRWVIRFSGAPETPPAPRQATTVWRKESLRMAPEDIVCPAQTGATEACATCGLCWAPAAAGKRIVFIGHGMRPGRKRKAAT